MTDEEKKKKTKSMFDRLKELSPFKPSVSETEDEEVQSTEQKVDRQGNVIIVKKKKKK
ncbi:MAG: hypothetical protein KDB74_01465 [Flavobacteriales bacterium]|nr:hypothetical protein [Flavobacteriales bacterium]